MEKYGRALECDFPHNTVFPGIQSPEDYMQLLKKYPKVAPHLLPKEPGSNLIKPTLRHTGTSKLTIRVNTLTM